MTSSSRRKQESTLLPFSTIGGGRGGVGIGFFSHSHHHYPDAHHTHYIHHTHHTPATMFKSKRNTASISSSSSPNNMPDRIRSRQPFSAVPLEQRRQGQSHVPLDALLKVYDDYPSLVKDLETATEQLRLADEDLENAQRTASETQHLLDTEKEGREADGKAGKEALRLAEIAREKKIRDDLEPKIAELERKLKQTTGERDEARVEIRERKEEAEGWVGALEKLHKDSEDQIEREERAVEERKKVVERSREVNLEILEGLRNAGRVKKTDTARITGSRANSEKKPVSAFSERKSRKYDQAD